MVMSKLNNITNYEWNDDVFIHYIIKDSISLDTHGSDGVKITKRDCIAIAKHFNLFDDYISVDKIKDEIEIFKMNLDNLPGFDGFSAEYISFSTLLHYLEQLIKLKDEI